MGGHRRTFFLPMSSNTQACTSAATRKVLAPPNRRDCITIVFTFAQVEHDQLGGQLAQDGVLRQTHHRNQPVGATRLDLSKEPLLRLCDPIRGCLIAGRAGSTLAGNAVVHLFV